jgi:hypothetical protein
METHSQVRGAPTAIHGFQEAKSLCTRPAALPVPAMLSTAAHLLPIMLSGSMLQTAAMSDGSAMRRPAEGAAPVLFNSPGVAARCTCSRQTDSGNGPEHEVCQQRACSEVTAGQQLMDSRKVIHTSY